MSILRSELRDQRAAPGYVGVESMEPQSPGRSVSICVVIPCFNEAEVIERFYRRARAVFESIQFSEFRLVFVDDGSQDETLEILNQLAEDDARVMVCSLSRNFGHQIALTAGLQVADGDVVILMDSDLQHPPELIPEMMSRWRQGYDIVSAVRQETADASLLKRWTSHGFYHMFNMLSDTRVVDGAADFCLLSRQAHEAICRMPERHRFLRGMLSWMGFRRAFVPYTAPARANGQSKFTPLKMLRLATDAVFSFSVLPIKMAARIGLAVVAAGLAYVVFIVVRYEFWGDLVPGWSSLMCVCLILGGVQLVFIGVIGEYVARIFEESKGRPLYFLKQSPGDSKSDGRSTETELGLPQDAEEGERCHEEIRARQGNVPR